MKSKLAQLRAVAARNLKPAAIGSGLLALSVQAHAELPAEITTAITEGKDNAKALAVLVLVAICVVAGIKLMRRGIS